MEKDPDSFSWIPSHMNRAGGCRGSWNGPIPILDQPVTSLSNPTHPVSNGCQKFVRSLFFRRPDPDVIVVVHETDVFTRSSYGLQGYYRTELPIFITRIGSSKDYRLRRNQKW